MKIPKFLLFFLLASIFVFASCQTDPLSYAQKNIQGTWRVDSVETYLNDELVSTGPIDFFSKMDKDTTRTCSKGYWSAAHYSLAKGEEEKVIMTAFGQGDPVSSTVVFFDKDHMVLIGMDLADPEGTKRYDWYHTRITESEIQELCKPERPDY